MGAEQATPADDHAPVAQQLERRRGEPDAPHAVELARALRITRDDGHVRAAELDEEPRQDRLVPHVPIAVAADHEDRSGKLAHRSEPPCSGLRKTR